MSKLDQLKEQRANVHAKMKNILNVAEKEDRVFTEEEQSAFDSCKTEYANISARINREVEMLEMAREVAHNHVQNTQEMPKNENKKVVAFNDYVASGVKPQAALTQGTDSEGGYLVPAEQIHQTIIEPIEKISYVRSIATVHYLEGVKSLGVVGIETDLADWEWTTELSTGTEDDITFSKRPLTTNPVAKRVKVSKTLLRHTKEKASEIVLSRLAKKFAETEELAFLLGDGSGKPLGVFVADANGVSTGRDITASSATSISYDDVVDVYYSVPKAIRKSSIWSLHTDVVKAVAKIKDSNGNPIFVESFKDGVPDTLLGRPVYESDFAPNTIAANQYTMVFGDFSLYWILDSMQYSVQRLDELYAEANQTGFIGRMEADGHPILEKGFARLKQAAS